MREEVAVASRPALDLLMDVRLVDLQGVAEPGQAGRMRQIVDLAQRGRRGGGQGFARRRHGRLLQCLDLELTLCRISRPCSRSQSRFFSVLRLSCSRLALGERDLGLDPPALVVQVERHQREALLLDLADQAPDLLLVHQQLLGPVGLGLDVGRGAAQRVDAAADQVELAVADDDVAVGELHLAGADGLDLPALEHHAGLVALLDVVVEAGAAVLGDGHGARGRATPTN